eukprot:TRINITY_DN2790_c0_g1_i5.p1 TRINITY_DN2790_c0_g1~~TRINITY_DN2790_c0_g1_i5.p1  ORF type:complete len:376 (+),score=77.46 TRINITY_DN2790_c0_g1_i5:108-1235(+)
MVRLFLLAAGVVTANAVKVSQTMANMAHLHHAMEAAQDSACSAGPEVSKSDCLGRKGCMFLSLDTRNMCLPCEWGASKVPIPCSPPGSSYPQGVVKECDMTCSHQHLVTKVSLCTDVSGDINQEDCYAKGTASGVQCMWTAYKLADQTRKSMCGPCKIDGIGVVPRQLPGSMGPFPGSLIDATFSQCEDAVTGANKPCSGVPPGSDCGKAQPPMPPAQGQKPHLIANIDQLGLNTTVDAPKYFAAAVSPPYGKEQYAEAAKVAAAAAGYSTDKMTEVKQVQLAGRTEAPKSGPQLPDGFKAKPIEQLPGLMFPNEVFPDVLSEPHNAFTPKIDMTRTPVLFPGQQPGPGQFPPGTQQTLGLTQLEETPQLRGSWR